METLMEPPLAYLVLKLSQSLFQKAPAQLSADERSQVDRVAGKQLQIEQRIQTTVEAALVNLPDAYVDQAVAEVRGRYASRDEFLADLDRSGLDENTLRRAIERDLRFEAVLERVASREPAVSNTEAEIFYRLHHEQFQQPETRTLRHILLTINDSLSGSDRASARRKIADIRARLVTAPERFAELALANSECPTAMQGGLLGTVRRGQLYPELEAAAFRLRAGTLSEIVESPMGFHILRCEAVEPAAPVPFATAREKIVAYLTERRHKAAQKRWIAGLFATSGAAHAPVKAAA